MSSELDRGIGAALGLVSGFRCEDLQPEESWTKIERLFPDNLDTEVSKPFSALAPENRLAGLSSEQIQEYLDKLTAEHAARARKPRRKK